MASQRKLTALAFAAGLFEGEGYISRTQRHSWQVGVSMTDLEPLERFQKATGLGYISGPYHYADSKTRRREHHKPWWSWHTAYKPDILKLYGQIRRWLSPRRLATFKTAVAELKTVKTYKRRKVKR